MRQLKQDKPFKKLSRKELLEMLLEREKENEKLQKEVEKLTNELDTRNIKMKNIGSMAEAMLIFNGVFEDIDKAAKDYIENIKNMEKEWKDYLAKVKKEKNKDK